ncbi:hypothetical protein GUJ93_ZPchr0019g2650 [Zizania palustris]|uniref:Uncharacterized protein n=1 Tax=Zizania palustris TaxID=103762 RepID=A0A8J5SUD7_ZIZPA|nr:hypothetical protein GUJ93_ZPchr0019g2650 [Zizania palustris]
MGVDPAETNGEETRPLASRRAVEKSRLAAAGCFAGRRRRNAETYVQEEIMGAFLAIIFFLFGVNIN